MTIKDLKIKYFKKVTSFDIDLVLSYTLKKQREFIISHPEYQLSPAKIKSTNKLLEKRIAGYSIAVLTQEKEFYGLNFFVNKHVLVPRPETELMVDEALKVITPNSTIIDLGTGSGCIITTLAKQLVNYRLPVNNYQLFGVDISSQALAVARKNARNLRVANIKFVKSDLLSRFMNKKLLLNNHKLIILANLPYLTPSQVKKSPSIKFEPILALVAGNDGLKYYRQLFQQLVKLKIKNYSIFCEIDHTQTKAITQLINKILPSNKFTIVKDLANYNRLVIIKTPN